MRGERQWNSSDAARMDRSEAVCSKARTVATRREVGAFAIV
jgi:hypothetical protein